MNQIREISLIRFILIIAVFQTHLVLMNSCRQESSNSDKIEKLNIVVDSIQIRFVPDRRVQIFDYTISADGTRIVGRTSNPEAYEEVHRLSSRFPGMMLDSFFLSQPIGTAIINVSVGNIRSNPRHSAELSTQVLMGQEVTMWDKEGSWYYIQSPDQYLGWIDGGALFMMESDELTRYQKAEKVMFVNDFGLCYEAPDENTAVVSDLVAGDILKSCGISGEYYHIILPDGREAFVPASGVEPLEEIAGLGIPDWMQIKKTAFQFMGRPYLWGGTSGKGVDCSGFTKMVYLLNGLELPRDASQQVLSGINIPIDNELTNLNPGDFLFFGQRGEKGKKDRVTHVAIYIGGGRIIHSSERVQVQSLKPGDPDYAAHRRETLLSARRMISDNSLAHGIHFIKNNPGYGF